MLKGGTVLRLQEFNLEGKSIHAISRELGVSRNTVRKYLRGEGSVDKHEQPKRGSKLDPFKSVIDQWVKKDGLLNCQAMLIRLRDLGYSGGVTIIKDYVRPSRPPKAVKAVRRYVIAQELGLAEVDVRVVRFGQRTH